MILCFLICRKKTKKQDISVNIKAYEIPIPPKKNDNDKQYINIKFNVINVALFRILFKSFTNKNVMFLKFNIARKGITERIFSTFELYGINSPLK